MIKLEKICFKDFDKIIKCRWMLFLVTKKGFVLPLISFKKKKGGEIEWVKTKYFFKG